MKIITTKDLEQKQELLFLGLFEEDKDDYKNLSLALAEEIQEAIKKKRFSKKFGEMYSTTVADITARKIIVTGLGKKKDLTLEKARQLMGKLVSAAKGGKFVSLSTNIVQVVNSAAKFNEELLGRAVAEGLLLADYHFAKYLSEEKRGEKKPIDTVLLQWGGKEENFNKGLKTGRVIAESSNFVRDLVNEPASVANSVYLEKVAKNLATGYSSIKLKVLDKAELQKEGLNALLGVNAGSDNPPKLLLLEYRGAGNGKFTALVGKGITFDSGGYDLKPPRYMQDMKSDKAGGAAVMGTIKVAAELGLKQNLIGVIPVCENLISGSAQKPGDIVKAYNGKTIEIGDTDAEGRLILADALAYTEKKYSPEEIIDLATLTGACVVALGYYAAGMMGKDEKLIKELQSAGEESGDRVWPLPFYEDYQDWMDGTLADLNNISEKGKGYEAGSITGGVFLGKFVDKAKWVHIDIAGSSYWYVEGAYFGKGATGSGVRLLSYYLLDKK